MSIALLQPANVKYLVVHCSATPANQDLTVADIDRMHRLRGFLKIGYHFVIRRNGQVFEGRKLSEVGAHVEGFNSQSVGICLVGGTDAKLRSQDNFEPVQKESLRVLLRGLLEKFPNAQVVGHRDMPNVSKACPSFDVKTWWAKP